MRASLTLNLLALKRQWPANRWSVVTAAMDTRLMSSLMARVSIRRAVRSTLLDCPRQHALRFLAHLPAQSQAQHLEVSQQREARITERRGPVPLDEEVTDPRGAVADQWHCKEPRPIAGQRSERKAAERTGRSEIVQGAGERLAMRSHVVGPELGERRHARASRLDVVGHMGIVSLASRSRNAP